MNLGKVCGTLVSTGKYEALIGIKLLLVQPLEFDGRQKGSPIVAADATGAGSGETVFYVESREACLAMPEELTPVDAAIVGIVDRVNLELTGEGDSE